MNIATLFAIFCYAHLASGETHSLKYFYTATSGIPKFPEFVTVLLVDGQPASYYDSIVRRETPRQDWMKNAVDPDYWNRNTQNSIGAEQSFKANIGTAKQRFNQTGGIHTFQYMYGCEWDDDTQQKNGFRQYGYDGEDFIAYDMETFRWIAPVAEAEITQRKWNNIQGELAQRKHYITQECIEWLQKYVAYGKTSFQNKVARPVGSLLQKDSSSGVVCHATGFYPEGVMITWKKDGKEMQDDVDVGETLPNEDGTFQKRAVLNVSPEERKKGQYSCEVTHKSGGPIVLNWKEANNLPIIIAVCVVVAAILVVGIVAVVIKKKKGYTKAPQSDASSDNSGAQEGSGVKIPEAW
ncbi:hypothetical protein ACEWY4_023966 [Coilia grayii]|uniref:Ig-like domain-containing protein n=1 Tax=Coilia grayii TaxID=363190 RepID=A0ABD1IZ21_9TELE